MTVEGKFGMRTLKVFMKMYSKELKKQVIKYKYIKYISIKLE